VTNVAVVVAAGEVVAVGGNQIEQNWNVEGKYYLHCRFGFISFDNAALFPFGY